MTITNETASIAISEIPHEKRRFIWGSVAEKRKDDDGSMVLLYFGSCEIFLRLTFLIYLQLRV